MENVAGGRAAPVRRPQLRLPGTALLERHGRHHPGATPWSPSRLQPEGVPRRGLRDGGCWAPTTFASSTSCRPANMGWPGGGAPRSVMFTVPPRRAGGRGGEGGPRDCAPARCTSWSCTICAACGATRTAWRATPAHRTWRPRPPSWCAPCCLGRTRRGVRGGPVRHGRHPAQPDHGLRAAAPRRSRSDPDGSRRSTRSPYAGSTCCSARRGSAWSSGSITERLGRARGDAGLPRYDRLTVAAVAARCGFSSPSHFSRRFQAAYGVAPSGWRRQRRTEAADGAG